MKLSTIKELALELGFDDCGAAPVQRLDRDADFMDRWVDSGYAGKMDYLERNRDKRYDIAALVPGAKTVVVCLLSYEKSGRDYHRTVKSKLYQLEAAIVEKGKNLSPPLSSGEGESGQLTNMEVQHIFCDSAPVLERRWAQLAGLGTIGYNHQLIHPTLGSFVHPGELVLNIELEDMPERLEVDWRIGAPCGDCRACIEACPGKALGHEVWDPRLCIAYETHHCTVCQAVCPKNRQ